MTLKERILKDRPAIMVSSEQEANEALKAFEERGVEKSEEIYEYDHTTTNVSFSKISKVNFFCDLLDCDNSMTLSEFKERYPLENEKWTPKEGEEVLVRDNCYQQWEPKIFGAKIGRFYFCIEEYSEFKYKNGEEFSLVPWSQIKKLETKLKLTKEEFKAKFNIEFDNIEIV